MLKIEIESFIRPNLIFEEKPLSEGGFKVGERSYWSAIEFSTDFDIYDLVGKHSKIQLVWKSNPKEKWLLTNAHIMPLKGKFVATFEKVERL